MRKFFRWLLKKPIAKIKVEEALRKEMRMRLLFPNLRSKDVYKSSSR